MAREKMQIVIVGHVDHGKSTIIGRLLVDTGSLPQGKLEDVKERCRQNSKVFEYAFLLDALSDERAQGITIDSARCFFKSDKRDYLIIDAPGHIEFLKNMISGAARAEAALLVIDAQEGIQENSKRHGYMLSMLGIKQVIVCVNKMDLVNYDEMVFDQIKNDYSAFLKEIGIEPKDFIPVSGLEGENIALASEKMPWFNGHTVLTALDSFEKEVASDQKPLRLPVQDVYKFTGKGDKRRIVAGRVESGVLNVGDEVIFLPSNKRSQIKSLEGFNLDTAEKVSSGYSTGVTLAEQIYVGRGEIMCRDGEQLPLVSSTLKAHIFWMGKMPMVPGKEYKLKIATAKVPVKLKEIMQVMDASDLSQEKKPLIERHEVAECVLECLSPVAFDLFADIAVTGRFVIVDNYDIAGGGIITEFMADDQAEAREQVFLREKKWEPSLISFGQRAARYGQLPKLVLLTGQTGVDKKNIAKQLEKKLFESGRKAYFLGIGNLLRGLDADIDKQEREEHVRRLGEVAHILMDAGLIVVASASDLTNDELKDLQTGVGESNLYIVTVGKARLEESLADLVLGESDSAETNAIKVLDLLKFKKIMFNL